LHELAVMRITTLLASFGALLCKPAGLRRPAFWRNCPTVFPYGRIHPAADGALSGQCYADCGGTQMNAMGDRNVEQQTAAGDRQATKRRISASDT
jgi:hypothetical protein